MTGPSDTILTWCEECGKYVQNVTLHAMRAHPVPPPPPPDGS